MAFEIIKLTYLLTRRDSDVISSYHICVSSFPATMWGKL